MHSQYRPTRPRPVAAVGAPPTDDIIRANLGAQRHGTSEQLVPFLREARPRISVALAMPDRLQPQLRDAAHVFPANGIV